MDFITSIPKIKNKNDSIFVVVDKFSKATHFIQVNSTYKEVHIVRIITPLLSNSVICLNQDSCLN